MGPWCEPCKDLGKLRFMDVRSLRIQLALGLSRGLVHRFYKVDGQLELVQTYTYVTCVYYIFAILQLHTYMHAYIYIATYLPTYLPTYLHTYIHTYIRRGLSDPAPPPAPAAPKAAASQPEVASAQPVDARV